MGDPMIPVHAGLCIGAAKKVPVFMAGGTQMAGVLSVIKELDNKSIDNLIISSTNWILKDKTSNIVDLVNEIHPIPIIATKLSFADSKHTGLQTYEKGIVKEGVGAGGAAISAYLKSKAKINNEELMKKIEGIYKELLLQQKR
jgi:NaMN:DMB phosphoribosyltransferase